MDKLFVGQRPAEQVALELVAFQVPQVMKLFLRLDAFRYDVQLHMMPKLDHCTDDGRFFGVMSQSLNEGTIQLHLMNG
ncbi:hypothetical protein D3C77_690260 [compost metagenome]